MQSLRIVTVRSAYRHWLIGATTGRGCGQATILAGAGRAFCAKPLVFFLGGAAW